MRLEQFGGLATFVDATNLQPYSSPDCSDVEFIKGLVRSRPGTTSVFAALGGNPTVNYLKSYITPTILLRALVLDSLGNFYKENPIGTLALIGQIENSGVYGNSVSLFNREYIAFGDGKIGVAIPRQFDDTNFDRVSQVGPGAAPSVIDESISFTVAAVGVPGAGMMGPGNVSSGSEAGNICSLVVTFGGLNASVQVKTGDQVTITGLPVGGYNGTFIVSSDALFTNFSQTTLQYFNPTSGLANTAGAASAVQFPYAVIKFTTPETALKNIPQGVNAVIAGVANAAYNGTWRVAYTDFTGAGGNGQVIVNFNQFAVANSGGGTATVAGNIVAGVHRISVVFVTRQGYITVPAPPQKWTAAGGKRVVVGNIPTGPSNVISRIIIFTAAGGQSFFYSIGDPSIPTSSMVINDNTTTQTTLDFSDGILLSGVNADAFFNLLELGECSGVTQYSSRLFWWGERSKVQNFLNLTFDGGFSLIAQGILPLGWAADATVFNGGGQASVGGGPIVWGDAYTIIGNGVAAVRGQMTQSAFQDANGVPIIQSNTAYSIRARVARGPGLIQGTLHIHMFSSSGGINTAGLQVTAAQAGIAYAEFTAPILPATATIPSDLVLRVYVDGTPSADFFVIDNIEIFQTNRPNNASLVRASKVEDPESYDGVTGFLNIAENNGQAVRAGFVIRNNLYFVKERSLYVTQDDGVNEPNQWTVQEISQKVGTPSVRGAALGDEWAVIAGVDGVYYFDGGEPQKISQEIQPTWDSINWSLGHLIDVKVDTKRKRLYIAVPLGASATANNKVLTLDYTDGFGDPNPTNTMNIAGIGRKWSPWAIACNSMNLILRSDGTQQLWFGNGTGISAATGKMYQLDTTGTVFNDDGAAINSYWQSGYFQDVGRLTFGLLVANVVGAGTCNLILRKGGQSWVTNLRGWILSLLGIRNMERNLNIETERLALRFGTNAVGAHFSLQGVQLYAKAATWATVRGVNAP